MRDLNMSELPIKKLYYSIAEVGKMTDLKPFVLRYWETEFKELRPAKNRAGNRIYRTSDIELIKKIKRLLYDDKYTIAGARQQLKQEKENSGETQLTLLLDNLKNDNLKQDIKEILEEILKLLEDLQKNSGRGAVG